MNSKPLLYILLGLLCTIQFPVFAQPFTSSGLTTGKSIPHYNEGYDHPIEEERCGTDEHHAYLLKSDPEYRERYFRHSALLDSVLNSPTIYSRSLPPQYTIPVVVHVIHLGEAVGSGSNISDAQIQGAITGLNQRYANMNGQGLNIEIDFCLANRDPNGCPSSGINRVNGSGVPLYTSDGIEFNNNCGAEETAVKDLSKWSPLDYYNIWVVHNICGDWSGYAYYPSGSDYDGTVIDRNSMTSTSWTLSHELGHGLNLRHTFNGDNDGNSCPPNNNCATEGDFICDTPPHKRGDCGSTNPCTPNGVWNNSRYNWMSYCGSLNTVGKFTSDQKTRMRAAMEVFPREELQDSPGCDGPEAPLITSSNAPMCSGTTRALTGTPPGGTFTVLSGPGTINGNTLTATGAGTIVIRYTACSGNVNQNITAFQSPTPVFTSSNAPICSGATRTLTGTPAGGTFSMVSGPGTINGNILTSTGAGTIVVQYAVTQNGCTGTTTQSIVSNQTPTPTITSSNAPICSGQTRTLTGTPTGGTFSIVSGPGTINGNILTSTGAGTIIIQYAVTQNGCTGTTNQNITSNQTPIPTITSSNAPICSGETRTLTGTPTGGIFSVVSGPGTINGNILTSTGAGTIIIQYAVTQNGCTGIASQNIVSNQTPMPVITSSGDPICSGQTRTLTATPIGGLFSLVSGPATINGNILTSTGVGTIIIQYTITLNGCTGTTNQNITSFQTPSPQITSDNSPICSEETRVLSAVPVGGTFDVLSGPGSVNGNVLTSIGAGTIVIEYSLVINGCEGTATQDIISFQTPEPEITSDNFPMCSGETRVLTAIPSGGTFDIISGPGTLNGFVLTATGEGIIFIQYEYSENGCIGLTTQSIVAFETPEPEITSDDGPMCSGDVRVLTGTPINGEFSLLSGPAELNGNLLLSTGAGNILIEYYVEENNCNGSTTQQIQSTQTPEPEIISDDSPMCAGDTRVIQTIPTGGELDIISGPGTLNGQVLTATGNGAILLQYTYTQNNCEGETFQTIQSYSIPQPQFTSDLDPMCSGESRVLSALPVGGEFELISGPATLNGNQLHCEGGGIIIVSYQVDNNGCIGTETVSIVANETPTPSITAQSEMCENESQTLIGTPAGGNFSVLLGPGTLAGNVLTSTGFGIITVEYVVNQNNCLGSTTENILSIIEPSPIISSSNDSLCSQESRLLTGVPEGGTFIVISGPGIVNGQNLTATDSGTIIIAYAVTANGCTGTVTQSIEAIASPEPVFLNDNSPMCFNETRELSAQPPGGTFSIASGPGMLNGAVLSTTGSGIITIHYTLTANNCTTIATQEIGVSLGEFPMIVSGNSPICSGDMRLLQGTPVGGIFTVLSGPGTIDNGVLFSTGSGIIEIAYQTCAGEVTQSIVSHLSPAPTFISTDASMCIGEHRDLESSIPGGVFSILSGPGILIGNTLEVLDQGVIEIEYTVMVNGCSGSVLQSIMSFEIPVAEAILENNVLMATQSIGEFQWVDCDLNFQLIPGETNSSFSVTTTGTYAVIFSQNHCLDTSACVAVTITNVNESNVRDKILVYPNPTGGLIFIKNLNNDAIHSIVIRDLIGHIILKRSYPELQMESIDLTSLNAGVYFLDIELERDSHFIHVIIKI